MVILWFKRNETVLLDSTLSLEENRNLKFQKYIKDYLATVRSVDDNIGRVLNYLKENTWRTTRLLFILLIKAFSLVSMDGLIRDLCMKNPAECHL